MNCIGTDTTEEQAFNQCCRSGCMLIMLRTTPPVLVCFLVVFQQASKHMVVSEVLSNSAACGAKPQCCHAIATASLGDCKHERDVRVCCSQGKYDDLPEMAFYMVGDITEVQEKADNMAKEIAARKVRAGPGAA